MIINTENRCGCIRCQKERKISFFSPDGIFDPEYYNKLGFRYACEKCGNKRCPHHTDHRNACTDSNEPGQPGSDY